MHRAAGVDDKSLVLAAVLENVLLLIAATSVALLCLAMGGPYENLAAAAGAGLLGALVVLAMVLRVSGRRLGPLLAAFLFALCFFALMAAIIAAVAMILGAGFAWEICGSGVAAWIAGFVTPGSPGGLGVREAAMVLLGRQAAAPDVLLMTALLFRVVTFGGDIVWRGVWSGAFPGSRRIGCGERLSLSLHQFADEGNQPRSGGCAASAPIPGFAELHRSSVRYRR